MPRKLIDLGEKNPKKPKTDSSEFSMEMVLVYSPDYTIGCACYLLPPKMSPQVSQII